MARVLVIDDDEEMRRAMCEVLSRAGYVTVEAADGRAGLTRNREHPADVVITDIFMPEKEGIETILAIRHEFPEARIIAISGGGDGSRFSYLSYARELGATRTLAKPFSTSELLGAIEEILGAQDNGRRSGADGTPAR